MIYLRKWEDLSNFGIIPLTGEACTLMLRILCDVTEPGKRRLQTLFSVRDIVLQDAWNSDKDEPHVGSIMLAPDFFGPISVFCLLDVGCSSVFELEGKVLVGIEQGDEPDFVEQWREKNQSWIRRRYALPLGGSDRNRHLMTGRLA